MVACKSSFTTIHETEEGYVESFFIVGEISYNIIVPQGHSPKQYSFTTGSCTSKGITCNFVYVDGSVMYFCTSDDVPNKKNIRETFGDTIVSKRFGREWAAQGLLFDSLLYISDPTDSSFLIKRVVFKDYFYKEGYGLEGYNKKEAVVDGDFGYSEEGYWKDKIGGRTIDYTISIGYYNVSSERKTIFDICINAFNKNNYVLRTTKE